ncbi:MAG: hypothetical protein E7423_01920 [Ruminococcaceae bacterium]|nr:hypothetical protein [Oscillospiraceae bacterium]
MECWAEIKGTDGRYEISSYGRVWSNISRKILRSYVNSAGYVLITFPINGEKKRRQVHKLVADAFIPNPENKPQINHIDADRTNNHVENLEWCTASENTRHAFKLGRAKRAPHHEKAVVRSDGKEYRSMSEAARDLGVPYSYIRDVCNGTQKTTRGYSFVRRG